MNTFVFSATLVCLAIAGGVNCKISGYRGIDKNYAHGDSKIVFDIKERQPSADYHSPTNKNEKMSFLQRKCRENSFLHKTFEIIQRETINFDTCLETRNVTETMRKLGEMNMKDLSEKDIIFFKSVCKKVPDWSDCGSNYFELFRECMNYIESEWYTSIQSISTDIGSFLCSNDADHIWEFLASGGVNCVQDKQDAINECFNTNSLVRNFGNASIDSLVNDLKFNREQCHDFRQLQSCLVYELSLCDDRTTSQLVNSMAELIFVNTPCLRYKNFYKRQKKSQDSTVKI